MTHIVSHSPHLRSTPAERVWFLESLNDFVGQGAHMTVSAFPYAMGRSSSNSLCLPFQGISKQHAIIRHTSAGLVLEDLESTNGTYINGERVSGQAPVHPDDVIHISNCGFRLGCWVTDDTESTIEATPTQKALHAEIAERKQMQQALWNSQARWRTLVESAPDGILIFNEEGIIESLNPAAEELFGRLQGDLIGHSLSTLFPQSDQAGNDNDNEVSQAIASGDLSALIGVQKTGLGMRSDGSLFPVELSVDVMHLTGQIAYTAILRDITERVQNEQLLHQALREAERAEREKTEFLANVGHEIRTPLASILGYAEMLKAQRNLTHPTLNREQGLDAIVRNGQFLNSLIEDTLDWARVENQTLSLDLTCCSIEEVIKETLSLIEWTNEKHTLAIETVVSPLVPPVIVADTNRLQQILTNLIGNAIKFTPVGEIRIHVDLDESEGAQLLRIRVSDTGIGIAPDQLTHLFQPFRQADPSVQKRFGGTGLGLAISRKLAQLMGGTLTAESQLNRGSCFTVTTALEVPTGSTYDCQVVTPKAELTDLNILLVDDCDDTRMLVDLLLKDAGADVVTATNGVNALETYKQSQQDGDCWDIILMDMQMPVMDGYEATRQLRAFGCQLPILALTAHAFSEEHQKCLVAGCNGYLPKPFSRDDLCHRISELVLSHQCIERVHQ